jgi:hypothetical protein
MAPAAPQDQRGIRRSGVGLLFRAAGERILISALHPSSYPQDATCDLDQEAPLATAANRLVPMDCGPNVDQVMSARRSDELGSRRRIKGFIANAFRSDTPCADQRRRACAAVLA